MNKKKLLPKIKALTPEVAKVDTFEISIVWDFTVSINDENKYFSDKKSYKNYYDALVDTRKVLEQLYAFLNANLGTHYVVRNDTESNMKDLGF